MIRPQTRVNGLNHFLIFGLIKPIPWRKKKRQGTQFNPVVICK